MVKVFGVDRIYCEYSQNGKRCKNKAKYLIVEPITRGCNTHAVCEEHKEEK